eukprot:1507551-Pyramimonas_sp.AAC.1
MSSGHWRLMVTKSRLSRVCASTNRPEGTWRPKGSFWLRNACRDICGFTTTPAGTLRRALRHFTSSFRSGRRAGTCAGPPQMVSM